MCGLMRAFSHANSEEKLIIIAVVIGLLILAYPLARWDYNRRHKDE